MFRFNIFPAPLQEGFISGLNNRADQTISSLCVRPMSIATRLSIEASNLIFGYRP